MAAGALAKVIRATLCCKESKEADSVGFIGILAAGLGRGTYAEGSVAGRALPVVAECCSCVVEFIAKEEVFNALTAFVRADKSSVEVDIWLVADW